VHRKRSITGKTWLSAIVCALLLAGCQPPPQRSGPVSNTPPERRDKDTTPPATQTPKPASKHWTPRPIAIRIYPSTRYVQEQGQAILEARIELFDAMGDSIKGSGQVRCELYALGEGDRATVGARLYNWEISLNTLDEHQRFYDPIIRGYVFRLKIDDIELTQRPTLLRVFFQPPGSDRLSTEGKINTDW